MSRARLFIENFLVYGMSGAIGKMIPFLMLPLITRMMPDSYYIGLNDISNTILSFTQAFAVMGMYDAMFRMFFEKENEAYKKEICSSAMGFTVAASFTVFMIMIIFREEIAGYILEDADLPDLVVVTALGMFFGAINNIAAAPTRIQNKRNVYFFTNLLTPLISYAAAIALLAGGEYVFALPIGNLLAVILSGCIFLFLNRRWFSVKAVKWNAIKVMLGIGVPLFPNFVIYWLFNSCDRLMIAKFLGMQEVGIYAVGAKFGHISQLIYTAFAGGWQYFAFSTMKDQDQVELTSDIFDYLCCLAMCSGIFISLFSEILFVPLFGEAYAEAKRVVPYLFMAPLVQMLYQVSMNQFIVIKKTWPSSCLLLSGALGNILLNAWLIPVIGIEGAAIATLAGFAISAMICVAVLSRMKLFVIHKRSVVTGGLFLLYLISCSLCEGTGIVRQAAFALVVWMIYALLYKKELRMVLCLLTREGYT